MRIVGDMRNADVHSYCSFSTSSSVKAESKMMQTSSDMDGQSSSSDEDGVSDIVPSYDEVMRVANPKDANMWEEADRPRMNLVGPTGMDAKNRELSMEERCRERKERVAALQRQAEERVAAKNREKELKEK